MTDSGRLNAAEKKLERRSFSEEELSLRDDCWFYEGRASAAVALANLLDKKAGEEFVNRNDSLARTLRDLSEEIVKWGDEQEKARDTARETLGCDP